MNSRQFSIADISSLGESQFLEFKKSGNLQKEAFTALCAMVNANAGTGTVVFGVEPNRNLCGLQGTDLDSLQRTLSNHARQKIDPPLQIEMESAHCEGKPILLLRATRNRGVAFHEYDGRAYIREGSVSRQLSVAEKTHLAMSRNRDLHNGPWRCDKCGAFIGSFSGVDLTDKGPVKSYRHRCGGELWPAT